MKAKRQYRPRIQEDALRDFQIRLLRWFGRHGRDLPWRRTRDPYKILVSEVMLQQTQVDRVREYYGRFLTEYPSVQELAAARPSQVLESWDGLGYYARARHLHRTARMIVREHGGQFPGQVEELMELPGIGRYTAGALVSFAFGRPAPILDTNVRRVLTRVFVRRRPASRVALDRRLWAMAELLIPGGRAWDFNQALMDFGATVCTARNPACSTCPLYGPCAWGRRVDRECEQKPMTERSTG